jgi:drug/metabolite transporter (DMT)-like permease
MRLGSIRPRDLALFAVMCAIWGLTWIAIRAGVEVLPPFFFAACRFLAAGPILLAMAVLAGHRLAVTGHWLRLLWTAMLTNTLCYAAAFWGMRFVPSGFSAVISEALTPVAVFVVALLARQESFSRARFAAVVLGVAGLLVMFEGRSSIDPSPEALAGTLAIVVGTLSFCIGSVFTRPLAQNLPALVVAGWHCVIGGIGLALMSIVMESPTPTLFGAFADPWILASWAFLVLCGSIAAYTIYLRLLDAWGPTPAIGYSFVSPAIAVAAGVLVFAEQYTSTEGVGALIMLTATALMVRTVGK